MEPGKARCWQEAAGGVGGTVSERGGGRGSGRDPGGWQVRVSRSPGASHQEGLPERSHSNERLPKREGPELGFSGPRGGCQVTAPRVTREVVSGGGSSPPLQTPGRSGSESESAFCLGAQGLGQPPREGTRETGFENNLDPSRHLAACRGEEAGTPGGTQAGLAPRSRDLRDSASEGNPVG